MPDAMYAADSDLIDEYTMNIHVPFITLKRAKEFEFDSTEYSGRDEKKYSLCPSHFLFGEWRRK